MSAAPASIAPPSVPRQVIGRPATARGRSEAGFSFIEVMIAMSILAVGSVSILSLLALGVHHQIERRTEERIQQATPEVAAILQSLVDKTSPGKFPEDVKDITLSNPRFTMDVKWLPRTEDLSGFLAMVTIRERGRAIRVMGPMPITRSTLDPETIITGDEGSGR